MLLEGTRYKVVAPEYLAERQVIALERIAVALDSPAAQGSHSPATPDAPADGAVGREYP